MDKNWNGRDYWVKAEITVNENEVKNAVEKAIVDLKYEDGNDVSVTELQNLIEDQNREIAELKKQIDDKVKKKRLLAIINNQKEKIHKLKEWQTKNNKTIRYSSRFYTERLAFINITSTPTNVDVYVNDKWIGTTPLKKYEVESGIEHKITLRPDPRYYKSYTMHKKFEPYIPIFEDITLEKGYGKILCVIDYPIKRVIINGKDYDYNENIHIIEMPAGNNNILEVFDSRGYTKYNIEIWQDEFIRKDIDENDYTISPYRVLEAGLKALENNGISYQYSYFFLDNGIALHGPVLQLNNPWSNSNDFLYLTVGSLTGDLDINYHEGYENRKCISKGKIRGLELGGAGGEKKQRMYIRFAYLWTVDGEKIDVLTGHVDKKNLWGIKFGAVPMLRITDNIDVYLGMDFLWCSIPRFTVGGTVGLTIHF